MNIGIAVFAGIAAFTGICIRWYIWRAKQALGGGGFFPRIPECGVDMSRTFITRRVESARKILRTRLKKGNGYLENLP